MLEALLTDFSNVLLNYRDPSYKGSLNEKHRELSSSVENYNILDYFYLNIVLLNYYKQLKARNIAVAIYTSENIQDDPNLQSFLGEVFSQDEIFSAQKLQIDKKEPNGYRKILQLLRRRSNETVFVDDTLVNIQAAGSAGLITVHFSSNEQAIAQIDKIFRQSSS